MSMVKRALEQRQSGRGMADYDRWFEMVRGWKTQEEWEAQAKEAEREQPKPKQGQQEIFS